MEIVLDLFLYIFNPDKQFSVWLSQYTVGMSYWGFLGILIMHHVTWLIGKYAFACWIVAHVRKRRLYTKPKSLRVQKIPRTRLAQWKRDLMATMQRSIKGKRLSRMGMILVGLEPYCQKFGIALVAIKPELYSWRDLAALGIGGSLSLSLDAAVLAWLGEDAKWFMYSAMFVFGAYLLWRWYKKNSHHTR